MVTGIRERARTPQGRVNLVTAGVIGALALVAWLVLWRLGSNIHDHGGAGSERAAHDHGTHDHGAHDHGDGSHSQVPIWTFTGGWALMLVAMMLPTTVPLVQTFGTVVRRRPDRLGLRTALISGFLAVWVGVGLAAYGVDTVLHEINDATGWLDDRGWVVVSATLVLAGIYQLTPLKDRCLAKCRSTRALVYSRWSGRRPARDAWSIGATHGRWCAGCCWALMVLMLALGTWTLGWMLLLAAVMAVEKNALWGARLTTPLGVGLLGIAAGLVLANV